MFKGFKECLLIILALIKGLSRRTILLYFLFVALIFLGADKDQAWNHMATSTLSRYMPAYDFLLDFNRDRKKFDLKKMEEFERYYRKVSQFMPLLPEAHAMLGFCCFYDGKILQSQQAYQEAIRVYSRVFNFHYNLGVISLKRKDLANALAHFKDSVEVVPLDNMQYVVNARIYKPFFPFAKQPDNMAMAMGQYTKDVYRQAYLHILAICDEIKDYKTMLEFSRRGLSGGFLARGIAYYYAGRAAYELKEYQNGVGYLQGAAKEGFYYAQTFNMLGLCLRALHRPESSSVLLAAVQLDREGKVYNLEELNTELLIY